jgi:TonB family protein
MKTIEPWVLAYLLNSLWQVPLVFLAAWAAARLVRPAGPRAEHKVWVAALLLQVLLPLCHFRLAGVLPRAWNLLSWLGQGAAPGGNVRVTLGPAATAGSAALRLPPPILWTMIAAYAGTLVYFAGRLAWGLRKTAIMPKQAVSATISESATQKLERSGAFRQAEIDPTAILISPAISGPVTIGVRHRILLLPPGFIEQIGEADLDAVLAHEFAHMRRHDFAKNLLYELLSLPIAYHPLLWLTRSRLAETRELVCDAVAAEAVTGRERYARSLLRLASMLSNRAPAKTLHAIGILDANIFERRIMNLTRKPVEIPGIRRAAIAAVCGVLAIAACASALAFRVDVDGPAATQTNAPKRLTVKATDLTALDRKVPVYPADAKANRDTIDGAVVLAVVIGKDGAPEHIAIKKSLRGDYDQSALDAVREWRWKPYLLNGDPIEVDTDISVTYSLAR